MRGFNLTIFWDEIFWILKGSLQKGKVVKKRPPKKDGKDAGNKGDITKKVLH